MSVVVPRYTLSDLDSFPDDGNRYELLDGVLLVTPTPAMPHEIVVARIARALYGYLPPELATVFRDRKFNRGRSSIRRTYGAIADHARAGAPAAT